MRIAVVQLAACPTSRTMCLQSALRSIDVAAAKDPAPDLIVLPVFAGLWPETDDGVNVCEPLHGPLTAGIAVRARSWGIFIVFGFYERSPDRLQKTSVLLDRDGDIRLAQRQMTGMDADSQSHPPGNGFATADILLGRIALLSGDDLYSAAAWDAVVRAKAQIVIGTMGWPMHNAGSKRTGSIRSLISKQASRCKRWCAMADITSEPYEGRDAHPGWSVIIMDTGEIFSAAEPGQTATLWADIPLPDLHQKRKSVRG